MADRNRRSKQRNAAEAAPTRTPLPPAKRRLFIALALVLPLAGLLAVEAVARVCGFGGYPPVIKIIGDWHGAQLATTYVPGAASYFDLSKSTPGTMGQYTFLHPKPAGTLRVMLAGASAMQGYPQPTAFASSAFLKEMLRDLWPDRRIDVINLGTTAVASFPVLDMLTQALAYEPDLVVVYAGHNEFYGAYGVASLQSAGDTPTAIRFHRWFGSLGAVQVLSRLTTRPVPPAGALMQVMAKEAQIGPGDPLRARAARNLQTHIGAMIDRCRAHGVPVIVCTLACNERDLAPIGTSDVSMLSPPDQARLAALLTEADGAAGPAVAIAALERAAELAPDHATVQFLLGRARWQAGEGARAAACFQLAVDLDPMPWRAPSPAVTAIRQAAAEHGAMLCDAQQAFRDASSNGCIGWDLMDDHVHFSLQGQALLARSIVTTLTGAEGHLRVDPAALAALPEWTVYAERLGENVYDTYSVAHGLRSVFSVPFMQTSNPAAYARWDERCKELLRHWPLALQQVAQEWQDPAQHSLVRRPLSGYIGRALIRDKAYADAEPLLEVAARCVPEFSSWNIEYLYFALLCRYQQAGGVLDAASARVAADTLERCEFLRGHGVGNPGLLDRYCGRLLQLQGHWAESIPRLVEARRHLWEAEKVACDAALIEAYVRTEQSAAARALAEDGVRNAGVYANQYRTFLEAIPAP